MDGTTWFQVQQWIAQVQRLLNEGRCTTPSFLRPYHFAVLSVLAGQQRLGSLRLPEHLERYAARMRLWDAIGLQTPIAVREYPPDGRFVPLVRLHTRDDVWDPAGQLAQITATFGADAETTEAVRTSMSEIMDNCFAHARVTGPLPGVACAQSWPAANLVQIALADSGIGIRSSLAENPELIEALENRNSCELATEFGVTSKPGQGHAGYGLALARQLLERAGGRLIVVSGNEYVQAHGAHLQYGQIRPTLAGTLVVLEWSTAAPLRLKDVYDSWPLPSGYTEDDFDL